MLQKIISLTYCVNQREIGLIYTFWGINQAILTYSQKCTEFKTDALVLITNVMANQLSTREQFGN